MWRHSCHAVDVSMGRTIARLVAHELGTVADPDTDGRVAFAAEMQQQFVTRSAGLDARERRLDERNGR
jgi:hypothetical protein